MEGFTYTNIFETKGIEYIIIIGFLLLIIPFWALLNKPLRVYQRTLKTIGYLSDRILKIPQGLFYSKNHTWTHLEPEGTAKVGLDDFLQHLTGPIQLSHVMQSGQRVTKGEVLVELHQNGKQLKITSPISGKVEMMNHAAIENSALINTDPYGMGWICKIKPDHWVAEMDSHLLGDDANRWMANEFNRFKDFLAQTMSKLSPHNTALVLQEGGELVDHPLSTLPIDVWQDFQTQFLD